MCKVLHDITLQYLGPLLRIADVTVGKLSSDLAVTTWWCNTVKLLSVSHTAFSLHGLLGCCVCERVLLTTALQNCSQPCAGKWLHKTFLLQQSFPLILTIFLFLLFSDNLETVFAVYAAIKTPDCIWKSIWLKLLHCCSKSLLHRGMSKPINRTVHSIISVFTSHS